MIRTKSLVGLLVTASIHTLLAADTGELQSRRKRAANAFGDGILLIHARSIPGDYEDGFHQDAAFLYFTGLENTTGAILAIDGRSHESYLFLPDRPLYSKVLPPEGSSGSEAVKQAGFDYIVDWSELDGFLAKAAIHRTNLYYIAPEVSLPELPPNLTGQATPPTAQAVDAWWNPHQIPSWVIVIANKWPALQLRESASHVYALMDVVSSSEMADLRPATKATVASVMAGIRSVRPGVSQRTVEQAMLNGCWQAGARNNYWPWAMSGQNGVFPRPWAGQVRYDHLDAVMKSGDLVRVDGGCEWNHFYGDLGRTVPVSGRFSSDQREVWNIFVAAYHAGVRAIHAGATAGQVFAAWRAELLRHRRTARNALAQEAIDAWSTREKVPDWGLHTLSPIAGDVQEPFCAGTAIAFEPIAPIGGQGYYLEDNFVITKDGAEPLTPGVPYSAEEIEAVMRTLHPTSRVQR